MSKDLTLSKDLATEAARRFYEQRRKHFCFVEKLLVACLIFEWLLFGVIALFVSPKTWYGLDSATHFHVWLAWGGGALVALFPTAMAFIAPGHRVTRTSVAIASMLFVTILTSIMGGRQDGHFIFFINMGFLALFEDMYTIVIGTLAVAVEHTTRNIFVPYSVWGQPETDWVFLAQHVGWVLFMVVGVSIYIVDSSRKKRLFMEQLVVREHEDRALREAVENEKEIAESKSSEARELAEQSRGEKQYLAESVESMLMAIERFSRYDLRVQLETGKSGDIGKLFDGFNAAIANVRRMVEQVSSAAGASSESGNSVHVISGNISDGITQQSQRLSDSSRALDDMTSTIAENTRQVAQAAEDAEQARNVARASGEVIKSTIVGMTELAAFVSDTSVRLDSLSERVKAIGEVIKVIENIANQTNLLSLNATIVAAGAGDAGKSFSVVANEVKELARNTKRSTMQVVETVHAIETETAALKEAMDQGRVRASDGATAARASGESLDGIIDRMESIASIISTIAAAFEEQSAVCRDVATNVEMVSVVSESSASGAVELRERASHLRGLTEELTTLTRQFQV